MIIPRFLPLALTILLPVLSAQAAQVKSVTSNNVTWEFDRAVESGKFVTGDPWIIGPVEVIAITNDLNTKGYEIKPGQNGSMLNPGTDSKQGYDGTLKSYDDSLNVALPGGKPLSKDNPISMKAGDTLISMVSWLWNSAEDTEPDAPRFNAGTDTPRPVTRMAGTLTVLEAAPEADAFRPAYNDLTNTVKYRFSQVDQSKLKNLKPVSSTPNADKLANAFARPWIDHVHEYLGAFVHPSEHMPNYGREMAVLASEAALMANLDYSALPGSPSKEPLLIGFIQYGIDCAGIAANGGGWPANGGHHAGRKLPILFAGTLLGDEEMVKLGGSQTVRYQENEQTFYVDQAVIDMTNSGEWKPDDRATVLPYDASMLGMPEWGIRHFKLPENDNAHFSATYRSVNAASYPGMALAARIMGLKEAWNHNAYFDYADRYMEWFLKTGPKPGTNQPGDFATEMWTTYRGEEDKMELKPEWEWKDTSESKGE